MNIKQRTIKSSFSLSGVGLHTGEAVNITFKSAPDNHGYTFSRVDLPGNPIIDADVDNVTDTSRGTTISQNGASVSTIEHVLAALVGCEVDNVLMELDGPEVPIMDGSSIEFIDALEKAGFVDQETDREYYTIPANIHYTEPDRKVEMVAMPLDDYRFTCMIDYNSPILGSQHAAITTLSEFKKEIASCRTFCFLHELEMLLENNLIKGGDLNNAIVVVDKEVSKEELKHLAKIFNKDDIDVAREGILNNIKLRHQNEPARHKLLDVVGDLALIGYPIKARIIANRPGHSSNVEFAKKIKQYIKKNKNIKDVPVYDPSATPVYTLEQIEKTLPHRHPFLLVDKIIELTDTSIVGVKNVTFNEWFFPGHFPGNPVMPGVLQIEALAQTGGILCINAMPKGNYDTYFLKINNCKFKQMVKPGDTMLLKLELMAPIRRGICEMRGTVYVNGKVATESELVAQVVKRAE
jgi:UDP-3-O-[3-hydroxymyristoyl] N-acetylglucosamine deacetylase/3-hydroxyacyl-[acyl-carrier-protein] dehydratase